MKKGEFLFVFFACILILQIFSFTFVVADIEQDQAVKSVIGVDPSKIPDLNDPNQIKADYLKKEWATILKSKPVIGPIITFVDGFFTILNPFFEKVLGVGYSFSWVFIFALMIWFGFFFFLYPITSQLVGNKWAGLGAAFVIASLIGLSGVIRKASDMLKFVINNIWIAWISLFVAIIIVVLLNKLGKNVKIKLKQSKEAAAKDQLKADREIIHRDARVAKKDFESYGSE